MNSPQEKLAALEKGFVESIGPMGKFVIKQQMILLQVTPENITNDHLPILVDKIIAAGVKDKMMERSIKNKLTAIISSTGYDPSLGI